jgi:hypothetical protein
MSFDEGQLNRALEAGDEKAAILALLPIVDGVAFRLFGRTEAEDYKQAAIVEILETGALRKYDPKKGRAFSYFNTVAMNALNRAWSADHENNVVAFGLPAKVKATVDFYEIVKTITTEPDLLDMASAISHQINEAGLVSVGRAGRYLARLGFKRGRRRALWAILKDGYGIHFEVVE